MILHACIGIYMCVYIHYARLILYNFSLKTLFYIKIYNIVNHIIFIGPLCDAVFYNILLRMFYSEIQNCTIQKIVLKIFNPLSLHRRLQLPFLPLLPPHQS